MRQNGIDHDAAIPPPCEGVFDKADLGRRAAELADFIVRGRSTASQPPLLSVSLMALLSLPPYCSSGPKPSLAPRCCAPGAVAGSAYR
jgi:hypothetical protein